MVVWHTVVYATILQNCIIFAYQTSFCDNFFKICELKNFLSYKNSKISYSRFGNGDKVLFCFHGYGEHADTFLFLENFLKEEYTIIAIDFPAHGDTIWNDDFFSPDDLLQIIHLLKPHPVEKISILGYSMGGRIALHILQHYPETIDNIALIAPDGLHVNFWYWLGTQTRAGNMLFKTTMNNPGWLFGLIKIVDATGTLNKSLLNFSRKFLSDEDERLMLYKRWTMMRYFRPKHNGILKALQNENIKLKILFGKFDRVILSKRSSFLRGQKNVSVKIMDAGHNLLREKHANEIIQLLQ